jgi:hypothetical protein
MNPVNPVTPLPRRRATVTRWTAAVLAVGTVLLGVALAAAAAYVLLFARALGSEVGPVDLLPDAVEALVHGGPAVGGGWVAGMVAARLLVTRVTWPPPVTGLVAGLIGCTVCLVVLHLLGRV